jgi:hypothetical protein
MVRATIMAEPLKPQPITTPEHSAQEKYLLERIQTAKLQAELHIDEILSSGGLEGISGPGNQLQRSVEIVYKNSHQGPREATGAFLEKRGDSPVIDLWTTALMDVGQPDVPEWAEKERFFVFRYDPRNQVLNRNSPPGSTTDPLGFVPAADLGEVSLVNRLSIYESGQKTVEAIMVGSGLLQPGYDTVPLLSINPPLIV